MAAVFNQVSSGLFNPSQISIGSGVGGSEYVEPEIVDRSQSVQTAVPISQNSRLQEELSKLPALTSSQYGNDGSPTPEQKKGLFGNALDFAENNPVLTRGILNAAVNYIGTGGDVGAGLYGLAGGVAKGFGEQQVVRQELRKINQAYKNALGKEAIQTSNQANIEGLKLQNILTKNKQELVDRKDFDDYQLINKGKLIENQLAKENLSAEYRHELNKQLAFIKASLDKNQTVFAADVGIIADSKKKVNGFIIAQEFNREAKPATRFSKEELSSIPREAFFTVPDGVGGTLAMVKNPKEHTPEVKLKVDSLRDSGSAYEELIKDLETGIKTPSDIRAAVAPYGLSNVIGDSKTRGILEIGAAIPGRMLTGAAMPDSEKRSFKSMYAVDLLDDDKTVLWKLKRSAKLFSEGATAADYGAQFQLGSDGKISLNSKDATRIAKEDLAAAKRDGIIGNTSSKPAQVVLGNGKKVNLKARQNKQGSLMSLIKKHF